jgi:hypothetical protein
VAEFNYRPTACRTTYRLVVVRKNLSVEKGERVLFDDVRYFFYLTNDWVREAAEVVFSANDRCDQENLLAQLHGGVRALRAPVDNLVSNWAYMVMTALAWDLKAWWALLLPKAPGRWQERHRAEKRWVLRLEFKTFVNAFVRIFIRRVSIAGTVSVLSQTFRVGKRYRGLYLWVVLDTGRGWLTAYLNGRVRQRWPYKLWNE